jgi:hypothetical protein
MGEQHRPQAFHRAWGFDLERFFAQVNLIRSTLPDEVRTANRIMQERERILESAAAERQRLEEAREQAALLVANDEIVRRATARAEEITQRANAQAADVRRGAEEYAVRALANLEEYVTRVLSAVRSARERLSAPPVEEPATGPAGGRRPFIGRGARPPGRRSPARGARKTGEAK